MRAGSRHPLGGVRVGSGPAAPATSGNQRRYPRLPVQCRITLQDRSSRWLATTGNVGPKGCMVLTPDPPSVGALVRLSLTSERLGAPLEAIGEIVWRSDGPTRAAGLSFIGPTPRVVTASPNAWFERLLAAELAVACVGGDSPVLAVEAYRGAPAVGALTPLEQQILRKLGEGVRASELLFGPETPGAFLSLLRRGAITLVRGCAASPAR